MSVIPCQGTCQETFIGYFYWLLKQMLQAIFLSYVQKLSTQLAIQNPQNLKDIFNLKLKSLK